MSEAIIGNSLAVLYILQLPLLIGLCIYNAKTVKKKGRTAAPFVWMTIGLGVATIVGSTLLWALLHFPLSNHGYVEGFLTVFLALCGGAASVLIAKRALNADDKREKMLSRSLRPEHFTNGQAFSRSNFDSWILESKKAAAKALTAYLCCIAGGTLLSVLFSAGIGGVFGNILALLCVFGGLIMGGSLAKKAGATAANYAHWLGISNTDIAAAKTRLKQGTTAWCLDDASDEQKNGKVQINAKA